MTALKQEAIQLVEQMPEKDAVYYPVYKYLKKQSYKYWAVP